MMTKFTVVAAAVLTLGVSAAAVQAQMAEPAPLPDPAKFDAQGQVNFVGIGDILEYKALDEYSEPDWVTTKFVDAGKLPPVEERLPKEPMVFKTGNMPDGIGVYGDVMRHVIGGRPEGWNYLGRPDPGLGRHRHRPVRVPDPHRPAVPGQGRRTCSRCPTSPRAGNGPRTASS